MIGSTQRFRRAAVHVLLLWLFAFGAGVVNACVVHPELRNAALVALRQDQAGVAAEAPSDTTADAPCVHHQTQDYSNLPCERFCEQPSAVSQAAKHDTDWASDFGLVLAATALVHDFDTMLEPGGTPRGNSVSWPASVPIPIAFLRLTL